MFPNTIVYKNTEVYAAKGRNIFEALIKDFTCGDSEDIVAVTNRVRTQPLTTESPTETTLTATSETEVTTSDITSECSGSSRVSHISYIKPTLSNLQARLPNGSRVSILEKQ